MENEFSSDSPINTPDQDRYDFEGFSKSLATSIRLMAPSNGLVIALNGLWGSGKTSAINLMLHHISVAEDAKSISIVRYNPWRYTDEAGLVGGFFSDLHTALGTLEDKRLQKALTAVAAHVFSFSRFAGAVAAAVTQTSWLAAGVEKAFQIFQRRLEKQKSFDTDLHELSSLLEAQKQKFLIVIDDIDRLAPEEALRVFRLVKSIGHLPNLIYLLVFDRSIADRLLEQYFPAEGKAYLEKIIQVNFDLPLVPRQTIHTAILSEIQEICRPILEDEFTRFGNIFHDVISPYIRSPRHVARLANSLRVTWPVVGAEVNLADYVAIESLRLFEPSLFSRVRENSDLLCGIESSSGHGTSKAALYDAIFLEGYAEREKEEIKTRLMRLFPRLEGIWSNSFYGEWNNEEWYRQRLVCNSASFPTYFAFAPSDEILPTAQINNFIANLPDGADYVRSLISSKNLRSGGTKLPVFFEELSSRAKVFPEEKVAPLLILLFKLADDMYVPADDARGMLSIANNRLRLHWLVNKILEDRFDQEARSQILLEAMKDGATGWVIDFSRRCYGQHQPNKDGHYSKEERERLVTSDVAGKFMSQADAALKRLAEEETLLNQPNALRLLYDWAGLTSDQVVKDWLGGQIPKDAIVIRLAEILPTSSWSMGMGMFGLGDRVAKQKFYLQKESLNRIVDLDRVLERAQQLQESDKLHPDQAALIDRFLRAAEAEDD